MSREHFRAIADALRESGASLETIKAIALVCERNNPRFDRDRFIRAATEGGR